MMSKIAANTISEQLTFLPLDSPAKTLVWPESEQDWKALEAACSGKLSESWESLGRLGLFSKTSPACFLRAKDATSPSCSTPWMNSGMVSQFFGVAQRRRRVFIVGRFGKPCPAEILFEPESGGGDIAESGEARPELAAPIGGGADGAGRFSEDVPYNLAAGFNLGAVGSYLEHEKRARELGRDPRGDDEHDGGTDDECAPAYSHRVRDFAGLPKGLDSARYRALGNAVTVSVAEWIARRILEQ